MEYASYFEDEIFTKSGVVRSRPLLSSPHADSLQVTYRTLSRNKGIHVNLAKEYHLLLRHPRDIR